ncbi:hypothetical protein [Thalassoglobus polymorphus]|uniref:Uncharacterized protein n=1 Tax=Thalassoglobus polymorphus TaxID=2527994 RepID=A0A517QQ73_9PLAN|nr:hypothetical protein [Thalassoglobus polymorphus]QDT33764.1 hypothetical protein Mal48_30190 [Thalassoglobus polymorphus]
MRLRNLRFSLIDDTEVETNHQTSGGQFGLTWEMSANYQLKV